MTRSAGARLTGGRGRWSATPGSCACTCCLRTRAAAATAWCVAGARVCRVQAVPWGQLAPRIRVHAANPCTYLVPSGLVSVQRAAMPKASRAWDRWATGAARDLRLLPDACFESAPDYSGSALADPTRATPRLLPSHLPRTGLARAARAARCPTSPGCRVFSYESKRPRACMHRPALHATAHPRRRVRAAAHQQAQPLPAHRDPPHPVREGRKALAVRLGRRAIVAGAKAHRRLEGGKRWL